MDVASTGSFNDPFSSAGKSRFKGIAFPSGHAAAVFSIATVVATRYHNHSGFHGCPTASQSPSAFRASRRWLISVECVSRSGARLRDYTLWDVESALKLAPD